MQFYSHSICLNELIPMKRKLCNITFLVNKSTRFVSSDDESGKKDHQPSKKKSKIPEKSKKLSSIKASNKFTEIVSSDNKNDEDSQSNSSLERTSGLETDSSSATPRKVTYHSLTELPKDMKDNLHISNYLISNLLNA
ncbi:hypothetical protein RhiirC2_802817 [Rhizophagus irregularis]|uniref:Uncharacterized protein n=1 Tax=Rhizophagus irregularis TaxID=588596 RepID=A0A2N1M0Y7_9GLOM|nr:hypothetical protein RhiirC2_802817 [Rhizophagus irregularis]